MSDVGSRSFCYGGDSPSCPFAKEIRQTEACITCCHCSVWNFCKWRNFYAVPLVITTAWSFKNAEFWEWSLLATSFRIQDSCICSYGFFGRSGWNSYICHLFIQHELTAELRCDSRTVLKTGIIFRLLLCVHESYCVREWFCVKMFFSLNHPQLSEFNFRNFRQLLLPQRPGVHV